MNLAGLSVLAQKARFLLDENTTTILTGVGVVGTVSTAYLAGRASFKAAELIEEAEKKHPLTAPLEEGEVTYGTVKLNLSKTEKVKLVWPQYIPAAISGVTTITCIVYANKIASKRMAALALASSISQRRMQEYQDKVLEKFGVKESTKVRDEIAQERVLRNPKDTRDVIITGEGDVLCYDMLTGRYFKSSAEKIRRAENRINHELNNFMHASLTEFYEHVGLPPTTYTDMVGWNGNDNLEVQISTVMSDDEKPCLAIDFTPPPNSEYHKLLHD
jgi:Family of unknown function (DUF6353)